MLQKCVFLSAILLWLGACMVSAEDLPVAADTDAKTQSHAPFDLTLPEAQKAAHASADRLDKMTPQEWEKGQQKFRILMQKLSQMTPEEKEKLGIPQSLATQKMPSSPPYMSLQEARGHAHAQAYKLDTMTPQEWNTHKDMAQALTKAYGNMSAADRKALMEKALNSRSGGSSASTIK